MDYMPVFGKSGSPRFGILWFGILFLLLTFTGAPTELAAQLSTADHLADPGFWDRGLDLVEKRLVAAETAAAEL